MCSRERWEQAPLGRPLFGAELAGRSLLVATTRPRARGSGRGCSGQWSSVERLKDMNPYRQNEVRDRRRKVAVVVSNVGAIVGCDALSAWLAQPRVDEGLDRASEFREIVQSVDPTAEFDSDLRCRSPPMLGG